MNKKIKLIIITVLVITIAACFFIYNLLNQGTDDVNQSGIRICPTSWYNDQIPSKEKLLKPTDSQYFIVNGENKKYEEMDVNWIKKNCAINQPKVVQ